jgi:hypothetical protein
LNPSTNVATSFIQKAFASLDPNEVANISKSYFLSTFLGSVEGLPISVSLASATRIGFPLLYVNAVFEELTGYSRRFIVGKNCKFLQGELSEIESITAFTEALRDAKPIKREITNYRKNHEMFRNFVYMKPLWNAKGVYSYVLGIQFEVTKSPSGSLSNLQMIDHLMSMLPDRLPQTDEYIPPYKECNDQDSEVEEEDKMFASNQVDGPGEENNRFKDVSD